MHKMNLSETHSLGYLPLERIEYRLFLSFVKHNQPLADIYKTNTYFKILSLLKELGCNSILHIPFHFEGPIYFGCDKHLKYLSFHVKLIINIFLIDLIM